MNSRPLRSLASVSQVAAARSTIATSHRFHSYDHPPRPSSSSDVEASLLAAAYKHVPDHGFSQRALTLGARDAGYLDISPSIFPDGPFSLIRHHLRTQRQALNLDPSSSSSSSSSDISARVAALTWKRLMGNQHIIHQWQDALAIMAQPTRLPDSLKELAALSDDILFLAGDKSVDPSWYTKRAALSMVYSSTELFMTNDTSPDFAETSKFMQRRLQEAQLVGGTLSSIGQFAGFTFSAGINVLRSKGVPI